MTKQMPKGGKTAKVLKKFEEADAKQDKALLGKLKAKAGAEGKAKKK